MFSHKKAGKSMMTLLWILIAALRVDKSETFYKDEDTEPRKHQCVGHMIIYLFLLKYTFVFHLSKRIERRIKIIREQYIKNEDVEKLPKPLALRVRLLRLASFAVYQTKLKNCMKLKGPQSRPLSSR